MINDTRPADPGTSFSEAVLFKPGSAGLALTVRDCLVRGTAGIGIDAVGGATTVERTVVQDTTAAAEPGVGAGIVVRASSGERALLTVRDSLVTGSRTAGIAVTNADGHLERTVVQDTRLGAIKGESLGAGVYAGYYEAQSKTTLTLRDSLLRRNSYSGLLLWSSAATVERVVVQETLDQDGAYGDGISAATAPGHGEVELTLARGFVGTSRRVGLLLSGGRGSVRGSVFQSNLIAVDVEEGADLTPGEDNVYHRNTEDGVRYGFGDVKPAPPIKIPPPP